MQLIIQIYNNNLSQKQLICNEYKQTEIIAIDTILVSQYNYFYDTLNFKLYQLYK